MPTLQIYLSDAKYIEITTLGNGNPHAIGKKWIEERLEQEKKVNKK